MKFKTFKGKDIVPGVVRLCTMNLYLHGIGGDENLIEEGDALISDPGERFDLVLTNPPFGKKSSITIVNSEGKADREALIYERSDFWATTSNKQLNFLQHVKTLLKINGRAAIVVPDNVLFEGGAGETVRRKLLAEFDVHTLLRLPTGLFYAQGVKTNVLFFTRGKTDQGNTKKVWIYDLRANMPAFGKTRPLKGQDFSDFESAYGNDPCATTKRKDQGEEGRFRCFTREHIKGRGDNLDISWLRDETGDAEEQLTEPDEIAAAIIGHLSNALEEVEALTEELEPQAAEEIA